MNVSIKKWMNKLANLLIIEWINNVPINDWINQQNMTKVVNNLAKIS